MENTLLKGEKMGKGKGITDLGNIPEHSARRLSLGFTVFMDEM